MRDPEADTDLFFLKKNLLKINASSKPNSSA